MRSFSAAAILAGAIFAFPAGALGQQWAASSHVAVQGVAPGQAMPVPSTPDFLFRRPNMTLTFRGGVFLNNTDSEIFDFVFDALTLQKSDFRSGSLGIEAGFWMGDRLEAVIGGDLSPGITRRSEDRDFVEDPSGAPIEQFTRLRQGPSITGGLKLHLLPRGESISRFAWTPARINASVGAGIGWTAYQFEQWGDFVDRASLEIFTADFVSTGSAFSPYVTGGLELSLNNRMSIVTEGRYIRARDDLERDFDFMRIDLSGFQLTAGLAFRL